MNSSNVCRSCVAHVFTSGYFDSETFQRSAFDGRALPPGRGFCFETTLVSRRYATPRFGGMRKRGIAGFSHRCCWKEYTGDWTSRLPTRDRRLAEANHHSLSPGGHPTPGQNNRVVDSLLPETVQRFACEVQHRHTKIALGCVSCRFDFTRFHSSQVRPGFQTRLPCCDVIFLSLPSISLPI